MADDVEAVRVALGLGKIDLLGHSCGGVLAEAYALKYQQHLSHLILNSTFASTREMNEVLAREKAADAARQARPPERTRTSRPLRQRSDLGARPLPSRVRNARLGLAATFRFLYGARPDSSYDPAKATPPPTGNSTARCGAPHGEFIIDGNLKSVEWVDRLPTIHVPTLIVAGDHDECDPSLSQEMHEKIAGSKLAILPNAGHMNFVDQPDLWQKAVGDFLGQ